MSKKPINRNSGSQNGPRNLIIVVGLVALALLVLTQLSDLTQDIKQFSFSEFLDQAQANQISEVKFAGQEVFGTLKDGNKFETVIGNYPKTWDILRENKVAFSIDSSASKASILWYLFLLLLPLISMAGIWYMMRQGRNGSNGGGGGGIFSMGKSRAKVFMPATIKENFDSVAGANEAKEELKDIVDYLRNPKKYGRLGAKVSRGILLVGEPGNGKTLLARAVAGEANCPFLSISGSDFIEVFVGVGASRVRDLFAQARKSAPSIIFIDEIDAVGRHRGSGMGGGNDEREQTLNQLLSEMDGFETFKDPVIVIAATNRVDVLDKALLRPGRFDRNVMVPYPDLKSREEILKLHLKKFKVDPALDIHKIARGTPGFSGAELANLINEAAIFASKKNQEFANMHDFEEARDKIILGKESKTISLTEEDRKLTAYHEAGHALITLMLPSETDPLHKVTITPRGKTLGVTHSMPEREKYDTTKTEMLARITMALGGRVAEELVFDKITTGAYSDFTTATKIARQMVCHYGMAQDVGFIVYSQSYGEYNYSEKMAEKIDTAVYKIISDCHERAKNIIIQNRDKLDKLANALLEKETLYASEIYELLAIEPRQDLRLNGI
jgi:cell division protease FtsH